MWAGLSCDRDRPAHVSTPPLKPARSACRRHVEALTSNAASSSVSASGWCIPAGAEAASASFSVCALSHVAHDAGVGTTSGPEQTSRPTPSSASGGGTQPFPLTSSHMYIAAAPLSSTMSLFGCRGKAGRLPQCVGWAMSVGGRYANGSWKIAPPGVLLMRGTAGGSKAAAVSARSTRAAVTRAAAVAGCIPIEDDR